MLQYKFFHEWDRATQNLPRLPLVDTIVTHGCTLRCHGCSSYSDYNMSGGNISWQEMIPHLDRLFERVRVDTFSLMGGEPFLNRDFETWVRGFRERYPYVMLMIVSNAQLLTKNPWIIDCMNQYGMIFLKLSDHIPGANYFKEAVNMIESNFDWTKENGIYQNKDRSLMFATTQDDIFRKTYRGEFHDMKPYDSEPDLSFEICDQKTCPLFYKGKLFKCSSLGMLENVLTDHDRHDDPEWAPYIRSGIDVHVCSDQEISSFVENYGKVSPLCRMCPTNRDRPYFNHYDKVINKITIERITNND